MIQTIKKELPESTKPIMKKILENEKTKIIGVGLKKGVEIAHHKAPSFAKIIVMQGAINYISEERNMILNHLDEFDIPLDETHKVIGLDDAIFLLIIHFE